MEAVVRPKTSPQNIQLKHKTAVTEKSTWYYCT